MALSTKVNPWVNTVVGSEVISRHSPCATGRQPVLGGKANGGLLKADSVAEATLFLTPAILHLKICGLLPKTFSAAAVVRDKDAKENSVLSSPVSQKVYSLLCLELAGFGGLSPFALIILCGLNQLGLTSVDGISIAAIIGIMTICGPMNALHVPRLIEITAELGRSFDGNSLLETSSDELELLSQNDAKRIKKKINLIYLIYSWIPYCWTYIAWSLNILLVYWKEPWLYLAVLPGILWYEIVYVCLLKFGVSVLLSSIGITRARIRRMTFNLRRDFSELSARRWLRTAGDQPKQNTDVRSVGTIVADFQKGLNAIEDAHGTVMEELNRTFCLAFFSYVALLVVALYYSMSAYILGPDKKDTDFSYYVRLSSTISLSLAQAFVLWNLAEDGQLLIDEAKVPLHLLESLHEECRDMMTKEDVVQVGQVIERLRQQPISADVSGIFTVGRSMLIAIANQVITYMVVIIQFRQTAMSG